MGLDSCYTCSITDSIASEPGYGSNDNLVTGRVRTPTSCDQDMIRFAYSCTPYRQGDLVECVEKMKNGGTVPTPATPLGPAHYPRDSPLNKAVHGVSISNYNNTTGTFELRLTHYYISQTTYQSPPTYSNAPPPTYGVINVLDRCVNTNGTIKNLTQANAQTPPNFGCTFTKSIALNYVGTENIMLPNGSQAPYVSVYTGQTTPGSGIPYIYMIFYSQYNNIYSYAPGY